MPTVSQCCPLWRREVVRAGDFLGIKVVEISQKTWEESHVIMKVLLELKYCLTFLMINNVSFEKKN